ncbi:hypothetical protein SAMN05421823_11841 [Catalinimonas alkaloidigena]|uniref:Uncharacterized protein n=1 Tax=Catalinimonas alkaloidigena TaxID=1075417 RepID=A0A1G9UYW6_9BACT|nr:hypothetical protein [Catalinimonas alkaloidigena]SDM65172.1 hypothetical protein SAMN05421823_11841 [Catalinimonas alkaloidigena]
MHAFAGPESYQTFICRAYGCTPQQEKGAHLTFMSGLSQAEQGNAESSSSLGDKETQLARVKDFMTGALDEFLKKGLTEPERQKLSRLRERTQEAATSAQLLTIIEEGLSVTIRFN